MIIQSSVGAGGANIFKDVRTVQLLLNDWRESKGLSTIALDGLFGPQTLGAIRLLQQRETHIVDGRIDPDGPALKVLVANHEGLILSFVVKNCTTILNNFDTQLSLLGPPLPVVQAPMSLVRANVELLRPRAALQPGITQTGATSRLLLGFRVGPPVFAAVQAIPVVLILAMFALLFMMAIIVARPALEHLARQLQKLLNAILDALRGIKQTLEDAFRGDLARAQRCQNPFLQAMALINEIFQDLKDLSASGERNPFVLNTIVNKLKLLERLANEFLKCMGLPPITLLGP